MIHYVDNETQFPLRSEDIRLLAQLGFMAASNGQLDIASQIFDSLSVIRSYKPFPYVGKAVALMYVGMLDEAITELTSAVSKVEEDEELIWIYLGLAYQRRGYSITSRKILNQLIASGELSEIDEQLVKSIIKNDPLL